MRAALLAPLAAAALLAAPVVARAESPRWGSLELGAGMYRPNIDGQAGLASPAPYGEIFGPHRGWMFRAGVSRALLTWPGALEVGVRTGFFRANGHALQLNPDGTPSTVPSTDPTTFNVIPTSLTLTYRFDLLAERVGIPLAPYARVALERYNWWITGGTGSTTKIGATNGYSLTGGVALLLDFFDPGAARELDEDTGINHTYLFFDVTKSQVKDFGSSRSWDLSDPSLSYGCGLMFVF